MSKLILSKASNVIELNRYGQGQVYIQNVADSLVGGNEFLLIFKIKTNIKESIEVKPIYGIVKTNGQNSKRLISIKYIGAPGQQHKIRLQIGWTKVDSKSIYLNQNGTKIVYPQLYGQSIAKYQQSRILLALEPWKEIKQKVQEPKQFRFEGLISEQGKERMSRIQKRMSQNQPEKIQKKSDGITIKQLVFLIVLSLLLGMNFGIKFEKLRLDEIATELFSHQTEL